MEEIINKLFDFDIKECKFKNLPVETTPKEYQEAKDKFINYFKQVQGVNSIYQIGSVSVYGLSDLDFVVVLDDGYRHRYGISYDFRYFLSNYKKVLRHPQHFISTNLIKCLPILYNIANLEKVGGEDIKFKEFNSQERERLTILNDLDMYIVRFPRIIMRPILEREINVLMTVSFIKKLGMYYRNLKSIAGIENSEFETFISEYELFRKKWFTNSKEHNLQQLLVFMRRGLKLVYYLIEEMKRYLKVNFYYDTLNKCQKENRASIECHGYVVRFEENWDPISSLNQTTNIFFKHKKYVQFLPINYSYHLLQYAKGDGQFSEFIDKQLFLKPDISFIKEHPLIKVRAEYMNRQIEFIEKNRICGGVSFCIFGYKYNFKRLPFERTFCRYKNLFAENMSPNIAIPG